MTPNQLTTSLAEPVGRQFDMPFKLMLFDQAMLLYAKFVRQTLEKDPRRRKEFLRAIYLKTRKVSTPVDTLETIKELPKTIFANGVAFDFVGTQDGVNPYTYVSSPAAIAFLSASKYTRRSQRFYTFVGNRIQLFPVFGTPQLRIDGMFTNPKLIFELSADATGDSFEDFWDTDLNAADDVLQLVVQHMKGNDLQIEPPQNDQESA